MKVIKQSLPNQNTYAVVANLVMQLGLKISAQGLKEIMGHKEYPNLFAISDTLSNWYVENMAVNLSAYQLKEIPYPAIAHLYKNSGHFVVLQKLDGELLQYIDPEIGLVKESLENFEKKWTGVVLLIQASEKSGEENYPQKKRQEIFQKVSLFTVGVLAILLALLPLAIIPLSHLSIYILKIIGGVLCFLLLKKQFGSSNATVDALCKMGSKSDCDSVINSPASKIFGVHLSEIGFWYFIGGLLSIVIGTLATDSSLLGPLSIFSAVVLLFSLFAVYYQGWVIKEWCPLCLAVMGVFWVEFITHFIIGNPFAMTGESLSIAFFGFSLPLIFWLSVRQQFLESLKLPKVERNLNRFLKSERVFQKLLEDQPEIEMENFFNELQAGVGEAPITITIVSNPVCGPCAYAHSVVEGLLEQFEGKIKVVFRFAINPSDTKSVSYEMLSHLMALLLSASNEKPFEALSGWYLKNGKNNVKKWKEENPISTNYNQDAITKLINEHTNWCAKAGINATPTILINGKKLPEEFSVVDLKYQIRKFIERIDQSVLSIQ
jgi:uncharacterized membrane protein/thiol-disulfide isomerase/thioredoxin